MLFYSFQESGRVMVNESGKTTLHGHGAGLSFSLMKVRRQFSHASPKAAGCERNNLIFLVHGKDSILTSTCRGFNRIPNFAAGTRECFLLLFGNSRNRNAQYEEQPQDKFSQQRSRHVPLHRADGAASCAESFHRVRHFPFFGLGSQCTSCSGLIYG